MNKYCIVFLFPFLIFYQTVQSQVVKILFDATKAETAGNADWVIDADAHNLGYSTGPAVLGSGNESNPQRFPNPVQSGVAGSTAETYWEGGLSYWGIDCVNQNYQVETLPYNGQITFGNSSNAQDLSNYKVFIVCEPNILFTSSEKTAILNFVQSGGGLFMISDHDVSDRNNDGWDSPHIWNDLLSNNSIQANPFGMTFDYQDFSQTTTNIPSLPGDSLLHGTAGNVTEAQWTNGTTLTMNPAMNPTVRGVIYKTTSAFGNNNVMCSYARYGNGKVAAIGDSSPCDDGSGDANDQLFTGYSVDANGNHRKLLMNITIWLATPNSTTSVPPTADFIASPLSVCLNQAVTFTDNSSQGITGYSWNFGSGALPATANTAGPHSIVYSSGGLKTISLTVTSAGGNATTTKTNYINVDANCQASDLGVFSLINPSSVNCPVFNSPLQLRIKNYGSNTVNFSLNHLDVIMQITNPSLVVQTFTKTITGGNLLSNATMDITFDSTYDLNLQGNYLFNANTVFTNDVNSSNNAMPATTVSVSHSFQTDYTVVSENMGTVSATTAISQHENNNGFENVNLTMSGSADIRNTQTSGGMYVGASGGANVFFTNTIGKNFIISGINTSVSNNLQLSFGIYKSTSAATGSDFQVLVSSDGMNYTTLTIPVLPAGVAWNYITVTGNIPAVSNLRIQFIQNGNTTQYRIDDVLLSGNNTLPIITTPDPVTFCLGDSAMLNASASSVYLWSNGMTTQSITVHTSGNYFVTETNVNGCTATSAPKNIIVNPLYINNINVTVCQGSSYVLPGGQIVSASGNYTSAFQASTGCDSIIYTHLTVINMNDNNACTNDACDPLTFIVSHTSVNLNDNNMCTTDACDPSTGIITHIPVNTSDNNLCTIDFCDPVTGNISHTSININDNNLCTDDVCDPSSGNISHTAINTDDNNICTLDGCNPLTGIYHLPATEICGNGIDDNCDGNIDEGCTVDLHLKFFIEGFYMGSGKMESVLFNSGLSIDSNACDSVTVELRNVTAPYSIAYYITGIVNILGEGEFIFPISVTGNNYYIKIVQRSTIESWSASPVYIVTNTYYDFTTSVSKTFGNNVIETIDNSGWAFYSGDISDATLGLGHQDGIIESQDYSDMQNAVSVTLSGYFPEDITGDGIVESADYSLMENNVYFTIVSMHP